MSRVVRFEPRGLTWYGQARDELAEAGRCVDGAREDLSESTEYYALFMIREARAQLDAAEASIRKTIRAREQSTRERELP